MKADGTKGKPKKKKKKKDAQEKEMCTNRESERTKSKKTGSVLQNS